MSDEAANPLPAATGITYAGNAAGDAPTPARPPGLTRTIGGPPEGAPPPSKSAVVARVVAVGMGALVVLAAGLVIGRATAPVAKATLLAAPPPVAQAAARSWTRAVPYRQVATSGSGAGDSGTGGSGTAGSGSGAGGSGTAGSGSGAGGSGTAGSGSGAGGSGSGAGGSGSGAGGSGSGAGGRPVTPYGRVGGLAGVIEPVGWQGTDRQASVWFVIVPTGRPAGEREEGFGLTVRVADNSVVGVPSLSALPFGEGALPPGSGTPVAAERDASAVLASWVGRNFGPMGALRTSEGVAAIGEPQVIGGWSARSGGTVLRVLVHLSTAAPGTAATAAADALRSAEAAVAAGAAAVSNDGKAVNQATANDTAATQALAAASAAAAANPAAVPAVAPAQADAVALTNALASAQAQLAADQARQALLQAAVVTDKAGIPAPFAAVGTYDVWIVGNQVTGWVPAGYRGG